MAQERTAWPSIWTGACAALTQAAAEPRIAESKVVAKRVQKRHLGIVDGNGVSFPLTFRVMFCAIKFSPGK
jgi:isopentenyldiphosphate isomerase